MLTIGQKVKHRYQNLTGILLEIHGGCNPTVKVKFNEREFESVLPMTDLIGL